MQTLKTILGKILEEYPSAKTMPFGENYLAQFIRQDFTKYLSNFISREKYKVVGHPGQGNWSAMPWVEILYKGLSKNIIYVTYIFNETYDGVYLSLQVKQNNQKDYLNIKEKYISSIDKMNISNKWSVGNNIDGITKYL